MMTNSMRGLDWQKIPIQPIRRAMVILGTQNQQHVHELLKAGELGAVVIGGKTLVLTSSLLAYLSKAQPWKPGDKIEE